MKPIASEWLARAEGDFAILERECRARKNPNYDGACFHAQQCAEKYLKARLPSARACVGSPCSNGGGIMFAMSERHGGPGNPPDIENVAAW